MLLVLDESVSFLLANYPDTKGFTHLVFLSDCGPHYRSIRTLSGYAVHFTEKFRKLNGALQRSACLSSAWPVSFSRFRRDCQRTSSPKRLSYSAHRPT